MKTRSSMIMIFSLCLSALTMTPLAAANCDNSGVQVFVGNYNCMVQYCEGTSGAGAGAGAGGPGSSAAEAGASAGTTCTQSAGDPVPPSCGGDSVQCTESEDGPLL